MDDSVFAQYNRGYPARMGVQGNPQSKYGTENNYAQAEGLLRGAAGKGDSAANAGPGAFANGNSYQMGQALQGLWNSGGGGTSPDTSGTTPDASGGGSSSGGGMDMSSMASIAMAFI